MEFETVIGLEIHSELKTLSKAYCSCKAEFGGKANTRCCPVCMGLPGTMPVLNKQVVEYAVRLGLAANCSINEYSRQARKNYFYPDLPKGYQITQSDKPLCYDGFVNLDGKKIRINRIHIEEDAGKLIHEDGRTKVDYNRAGIGLVEIVTEPDLRSSVQAGRFLEKIRQMLLDLGISDCKMQEGSLRCDVNVSVREKGKTEYNERCEMKNINSFSGVVRCIEYEEKRQKAILSSGGFVTNETRRWDDIKGESYLMRTKENQADYRYFPEPDIPVIHVTKDEIERIRRALPELSYERTERYKLDFSLRDEEARIISENKAYTKLFEESVKAGGSPITAAKFITGGISRILSRETDCVKEINFTGYELAGLLKMVDSNTITQTAAQNVLELMFEGIGTPEQIVKENNFTQISDKEAITEVIKSVLSENEKSVKDYKSGKKNAFGYLVGQCMKKSQNRANPEVVKEALNEILEVIR